MVNSSAHHGENNGRLLLVISGPTASGKTAAAIHMARLLGTCIISADSRQVYREMKIGTARPTEEELAAAPHYLIGHRSIEDGYSAGEYEMEALAAIQEVHNRHGVAILCGGSGLYIKAVCEGLDELPSVSDAARENANHTYHTGGLPALQKAVMAADPEFYGKADVMNPHRLLRALSFFIETGHKLSSFQTGMARRRPFTPLFIRIEMERSELYSRINDRVDAMLRNGLEEEARQLFEHRHLSPLQTVGYQELFDFFSGLIDREEAIRLVKRNSRRYAKRQLTWFRRDNFWNTVRSTAEIERLAASFPSL